MNPIVIDVEDIKEGWDWNDIALWNKTQYMAANILKCEVEMPSGSYLKRGRNNRKVRTSLKRLYKEFQIS